MYLKIVHKRINIYFIIMKEKFKYYKNANNEPYVL